MNASALAEWRASWSVVIAGVVGMAIGSFHTYSLGVMIAPIEAEFGWSRAQISSGLFISSLFAVVLAPFAGMAIDRFGPRRIALIGVTVYCVAFGALSQTSQDLWMWRLLWGFLALAFLFIKPTVWVAAISSLFNDSRGLALAIVLSGTGLSAFLTPIVTYYLVENYGWRTAYMIIGGGTTLFALPLTYFLFSSALDRARTRPASTANAAPAELVGLSIREGLRSLPFYRLGGTALIMAAANLAVAINLVPILTSDGLSRGSAASIAGVIGLSAIIGRLSCGYLLDRFNARVVTAVSVLLPVISCLLLLWMPGSAPIALAAVFIMGLASGAELDAVSYLSVKYFGMRSFGFLFGTIMGMIALGVGIGPVLANHVYDLTKSYDPVLWALLFVSLLTSVLFLTLGPYPRFENRETEATA